MEMRKCPRGHYYDASIHSDCPYCTSASVGGSDVGKTIGFTSNFVAAPQGGMAADDDDSKTLAYADVVQTPADDDDGKTIGFFKADMGIDPVVGWLVATSGSEKGRDYKIHSDNNSIGRGEKMDICLRGDEKISRDNQAFITYDAKEVAYFLSPGEGRSIIRVNDKAIFSTSELKPYDKITIGETDLVFVPLCGEKFAW